VLLDGPALGVDVVRHLHAQPAGHLVEVAEIALHLRDQGMPTEVGGVDVDGPGLLGHRVHGLLLAPHREADQLAALAVDDAADALLELVHAVIGEVRLDQEDGFVLAQVVRGALLCHVFLPLGLCPGSSARSGDAVSGRLPARPPGTGTPRARRPRAAAKERAGLTSGQGPLPSSRTGADIETAWIDRMIAREGRIDSSGFGVLPPVVA